jgi:hypothetical protein
MGDFIHLFHDAGWKILLDHTSILVPTPTDVLCRYDPDTEAGKALGASMKNLGAQVTPQKEPGFTGSVTIGVRPSF